MDPGDAHLRPHKRGSVETCFTARVLYELPPPQPGNANDLFIHIAARLNLSTKRHKRPHLLLRSTAIPYRTFSPQSRTLWCTKEDVDHNRRGEEALRMHLEGGENEGCLQCTKV